MRIRTVKDIMHPGIVSCSRSASPAEVAQVMISCRVHSVAVLGLSRDGREDPLIWGVVSDLDLLEALDQPGTRTAGELAHQPVVSIRSTATVREAASAMVSTGTHHLIVVEPDTQMPLGVVSTLDVATVLAEGPGAADDDPAVNGTATEAV